MKMKKYLSVRVDAGLLAAAAAPYGGLPQSTAGQVAGLLRGAAHLGEAAGQAAAEGFRALSLRLKELLGAPEPEQVKVPPLSPGTWGLGGGGPEPLELDWLVEEGVRAVLFRAGAADFDDLLEEGFPWGGGFLAQWGQAAGRALGLGVLGAAALGEFCRAWVYGISCRYGNLDCVVSEAEAAFAAALTGRLGAWPVIFAPERRALFPAEAGEAEAYRRAWEAVLAVLRGLEAGRFAPDGFGERLVDESGRPAAVVVLGG